MSHCPLVADPKGVNLALALHEQTLRLVLRGYKHVLERQAHQRISYHRAGSNAVSDHNNDVPANRSTYARAPRRRVNVAPKAEKMT